MFSKTFAALSVLLLVPHVIAHGVVTSPAPRTTGAASVAACGSAVVKKLGSGACSLFLLVPSNTLILDETSTVPYVSAHVEVEFPLRLSHRFKTRKTRRTATTTRPRARSTSAADTRSGRVPLRVCLALIYLYSVRGQHGQGTDVLRRRRRRVQGRHGGAPHGHSGKRPTSESTHQR